MLPAPAKIKTRIATAPFCPCEPAHLGTPRNSVRDNGLKRLSKMLNLLILIIPE